MSISRTATTPDFYTTRLYSMAFSVIYYKNLSRALLKATRIFQYEKLKGAFLPMRKTTKKVLSLVLTLCMVLTLLPTVALADTAGPFTIVRDGGGSMDASDYVYTAPVLEIKGTGSYTVTGTGTITERILISSNATVTLNNITIDVSGVSGAAVEVTATNATIILQGTNTLTSYNSRAGLQVMSPAGVTIEGTGSLTANGGGTGAGSSAGIGGNGSGAGTCGSVTIGGSVTVTANASGGGGGIGGGYGAGIDGTITIKDNATVTATGGSSSTLAGGAGIGSGADSSSVASGTIIIRDAAVVTAIGGSSSSGGGAAGIGGGGISASGVGPGAAGAAVTITTSGTVTATGGAGVTSAANGFDIGGGGSAASNDSPGASGTLTMSNGTLVLTANGYGGSTTTPAVITGATVSGAGAGSLAGTYGTPPAITTASLPNGEVGTAYSQALAATGSTPISWTLDSGTLPDGLSLSGDTISGTPTTAESQTFTVKAANGTSPDATQSLTIVIDAAPVGTAPSITTASLPNGEVGTAYSQALAATGSTPISWTLDSGTDRKSTRLNSSH